MGKRFLQRFLLAGLLPLVCMTAVQANPYTSEHALQSLRDAISQLSIVVNRGGWSPVPVWTGQQTGTTDAQLQAVHRRLLVSGDWIADSTERSLQRFQRRHGLLANGYLNRETIAALNIPASQRLRELEAALGKAVRLKGEIRSKRYVLVNIPAQELVAVTAGQTDLVSAVIVGHASRPTPEMKASITGVTIHPAWNVPPGITRNDLMPLLQKNPQYFEREDYEILRWRDGQQVSPLDAKNQRLTVNQIRFRRPPGPRNPLGRVRIDMPNAQSIFLHDTPATRMFGWPNRSFSSGCVRVSRIVELANWILKPDGWQPQQTSDLLRGRQTVRIGATSAVPVHLVYLTAWVSADGQVNFRKDLYRRLSGTGVTS